MASSSSTAALDKDAVLDCFLLSLRASQKALGRPISAKLNYLGSFASREAYKKALSAYFQDKISTMCDDCKRRLVINPLRILDCKVPEDQAVCQGAPRISDYLTPEDKADYQTILKTLDAMGVHYEVDDGLVRGLDYYTGLVWELYDEAHTGQSVPSAAEASTPL
jgi:histidyl-tRNA synthetase